MSDTELWRVAPDDLVRLGIKTVIVATPDLQGRLVGRRIPISQFPRVVEDGVEVCTCVFAWDLAQSLTLIEANVFPLCGMHNGLPDTVLRPDVATLRRAAWLDGVAICLADPHDIVTGAPLDISPRFILKKQLAAFRALGLEPRAGTELEFYLFESTPRQIRDGGFRDLRPTTMIPSDFMIHDGNAFEPFFQKLRDDLLASGIEVEAGQNEWGSGQWEMTFVYGEVLEMADRHSLYKLAVRDSAASAGMSATFMAMPLNGQPGSSCHVHFSALAADGASAFWAEGTERNMSATMSYAVAGAVENSPGFMALYAPTINSYRRANSGEVAGWGRTWGFDNRTCSARVVGHSPSALRFEFRLPGADTNPYLTLAALLASVRAGIETHAELKAPVQGNAYELPRDEGMPSQLHEAAELFSRSEVARSALGGEIVDHIAILAEHEWKVNQAYVSDWDLERYFDRI